jgi:TolB-like protein/Tfp pilus assembly protein PilF
MTGPCSNTAAIREQLTRILESQPFVRAERLRRFLAYVVEETAEGRTEGLKEYRIALDVFDRPDSYDPQVDSIVRVQATNLRRRLRQYYEKEGRADPIRIELPRGSYVPEFATVEPAARRVSWPWIAAGLLAAAAAAAIWFWPARQVSIAVLPLESLSADPEQDYFADGITDALIGRLAQIRSWRVISRTSAQRFKKTKTSLREIASKLGATHFVEGTVFRAGERVRITAQLIQADGDRQLWAGSYERDYQDILALQNEVTQGIARQVNIAMTPRERARMEAAPPVNREAHEAFLKGRYLWNKRGTESLKKAVEYFNQALQKDPGYAPAYAGLADAYNVLMTVGALSIDDHLPKAEEAARRALELDPDLTEARISLASLLEFRLEWDTAEELYRRAIEMDPNNARGHQWYAELIARRGRLGDALGERRLARELDPLSVMANAGLGMSLCANGFYSEAERQFQQALDLEPNHTRTRLLMAECHLWKGQYKQAIPLLEKITPSDQPDAIGALGYAYAKAGKTKEALGTLRELESLSKREYVSAFSLAEIYVGLGDRDRAFEWLDKACDERGFWIGFLQIDPKLDSIRADPRFTALVKKMKLEFRQK